MRDARLVVWPIGVYSVCPPPVEIERTTTSPVFTPTRHCSGLPPSATSCVEYRAQLILHPQRRRRARAADGPRARPARRTARRYRRRCDLHDVAVVSMDRVDHQLERRIDDRARLFGIEIPHRVQSIP